MANYGQYCPVAKAAELIGDRWTLLIIRELLYGPIRFGEIERNLPVISKSVLSQRLKRLKLDGIARTDSNGAYEFTELGETLRPVVQTMGEWVAAYVLGEPTRAEADPELLMLFVSRHVDVDRIPKRRVVTEWRFRDCNRRIWLTIEENDVSVCLEDPCLDVDVYVEGDTIGGFHWACEVPAPTRLSSNRCSYLMMLSRSSEQPMCGIRSGVWSSGRPCR